MPKYLSTLMPLSTDNFSSSEMVNGNFRLTWFNTQPPWQPQYLAFQDPRFLTIWEINYHSLLL